MSRQAPIPTCFTNILRLHGPMPKRQLVLRAKEERQAAGLNSPECNLYTAVRRMVDRGELVETHRTGVAHLALPKGKQSGRHELKGYVDVISGEAHFYAKAPGKPNHHGPAILTYITAQNSCKPTRGRDTSHLYPIIAELRALPEDPPN